jgi:hypothetical protein
MHSQTNNSLTRRDALLGALIYCAASPLLDLFFVSQILPAQGYELSVGGVMLRMLMMSVSLLLSSALLIVLLVKQSRRHVPLQGVKVAAWALLAALASVALLNVIGHDAICRPGACRGLGF